MDPPSALGVPRQVFRSAWAPSSRGCWPWAVSGDRGRCGGCAWMCACPVHPAEVSPLSVSRSLPRGLRGRKGNGKEQKGRKLAFNEHYCGQRTSPMWPRHPCHMRRASASPLYREVRGRQGHSAGACAGRTAGKRSWAERVNDRAPARHHAASQERGQDSPGPKAPSPQRSLGGQAALTLALSAGSGVERACWRECAGCQGDEVVARGTERM